MALKEISVPNRSSGPRKADEKELALDRDGGSSVMEHGSLRGRTALHNSDAEPRARTLVFSSTCFGPRVRHLATGRAEEYEASRSRETFSDCSSHVYDIVSADVNGDIAFAAGSAAERRSMAAAAVRPARDADLHQEDGSGRSPPDTRMPRARLRLSSRYRRLRHLRIRPEARAGRSPGVAHVKFYRRSLYDGVILQGARSTASATWTNSVPQRLVTATGPNPLSR